MMESVMESVIESLMEEDVKPGSSLKDPSEVLLKSMAHPKVQSRVEKWLNEIEDPQARKVQLGNTRIPIELILQVLQELLNRQDDCTATCLALTGRGFWNYFRKQHPRRILLTSKPPASKSTGDKDCRAFQLTKQFSIQEEYTYIAPVIFGEPNLGEILRPWFGPDYRYSRRLMTYLLRSVYGNEPEDGEECNAKEEKLVHRYRDYYNITCPEGSFSNRYILPNPFGMGNDWYHAALRAFVKHVEEACQYASEVTLPYFEDGVRMVNLGFRNEYARSTYMQKSYTWAWMEKYINWRLPDTPSWNCVPRSYYRRKSFWEAIVEASTQDWEKHFLLVEDGVDVPRLDLDSWV